MSQRYALFLRAALRLSLRVCSCWAKFGLLVWCARLATGIKYYHDPHCGYAWGVMMSVVVHIASALTTVEDGIET